MPDTFLITIIFIVACTVIGAFVKGRSKDACLKDFSGDNVFLEHTGGKLIWGNLLAENTALEFVYNKAYMDKKDNHVETSYVLYKSEYNSIKMILRYVDALTEEGRKEREKAFKKITDPGSRARFGRKVHNFFGTVRDSFLEILNLFMGQVKTKMPAGKIIAGQDKYVSEMSSRAHAAFNTAYEPVLERYIGKKVVLAVVSGGEKSEYSGVLNNYTSEFIEIMNVAMKKKTENSGEELCDADVIIPRSLAVVRHAGE
ncbi:MAG: hypothetical protein ISS33_03585 [Candidatus Omnitrophica bacterium]|nr:hypothetical protein [Candidatus Omnitrophota bacterium]